MTSPILTQAERRELLQIARDALATHLTNARAATGDLHGAAARPAAAFVTITVQGELRGCIGHMEGSLPLGDVVRRAAVSAAASDPRFPPIRAEELPAVVLEISVLGPLQRVDDPAVIEVGRHGLVVEDLAHRGLLLPQVAAEWGWDALEFLEHTCVKAGLRRDAWKHGASMWLFEADVFSEEGR